MAVLAHAAKIPHASRGSPAISLVLIVVGVFIRLGIWQLDRLEERRAQNETVAACMEMPPIGFDALLAGVPESEREFRRVVVTGVFDVDHEVLILIPTHNGEAGFHVVTPLVSDTGVTVLVNRDGCPSIWTNHRWGLLFLRRTWWRWQGPFAILVGSFPRPR